MLKSPVGIAKLHSFEQQKLPESESGKGIHFDGLIHKFSLKNLTSEKSFSKKLIWDCIKKLVYNTISFGHEVTPNLSAGPFADY